MSGLSGSQSVGAIEFALLWIIEQAIMLQTQMVQTKIIMRRMEMESEGGGGEEEAQDPYKGLFEGIHER
jgi:hypothetical protein